MFMLIAYPDVIRITMIGTQVKAKNSGNALMIFRVGQLAEQ